MGEMLNADLSSCPHQTQLILLGRKRVDVQITTQQLMTKYLSECEKTLNFHLCPFENV